MPWKYQAVILYTTQEGGSEEETELNLGRRLQVGRDYLINHKRHEQTEQGGRKNVPEDIPRGGE